MKEQVALLGLELWSCEQESSGPRLYLYVPLLVCKTKTSTFHFISLLRNVFCFPSMYEGHTQTLIKGMEPNSPLPVRSSHSKSCLIKKSTFGDVRIGRIPCYQCITFNNQAGFFLTECRDRVREWSHVLSMINQSIPWNLMWCLHFTKESGDTQTREEIRYFPFGGS